MNFSLHQHYKTTHYQPNTGTRLHDGPALIWPPVTHEKFKNFLPHSGPTLWNALPPNLRSLNDLDTFISKLKLHYKGIFIDNPEFD